MCANWRFSLLLDNLRLHRVIQIRTLEPELESFQVFSVPDSLSVRAKLSNRSRNSSSIILNGQVEHVEPFCLPDDIAWNEHWSLSAKNCCLIERAATGEICGKIVAARKASPSEQRLHCSCFITVDHQRPRVGE